MTTNETAPAEWSFAKRMGFRFCFIYFALYFFPLPSGLADPDAISGIFDKLWQKVVPWVGSHFFHVQVTTFSNGSGDTTYDYIRILCMAVIALVGAIAWSAFSRRREERTLYGWSRIWLRYALAISMLTYGLVKVIKLQFPVPGVGRLTETYGQSSPMGLLWTFMGFSTGYTFFAGAGEALSGLLLFFRRTTTFGALVVVVVMSNVVMLNFCYDVPVKIGSAHLLLLGFFLLAPDLGRLANLLVFNRATEPADMGPVVSRPWMRREGMALKVLVIAGFLFMELHSNIRQIEKVHAPKGPLEGAYEVESFRRSGVEVPPLITDGSRWRRMTVFPNVVALFGMDDKGKGFPFKADMGKGTLDLFDFKTQGTEAGKVPEGFFHFTWPDPAHLLLQGTFDGAPLEVRLKKKDASDFPLMNRGFHWISEFPYNR